MATPTLFLEPTSGHTSEITKAEATITGLKLVATLIAIRKINKNIALNTTSAIAEILVGPNETLASSLSGNHDAWLFLRTLAVRTPMYYGLDTFRDQAEGWEAKTLSNVEAQSLAWATICNTGTVSFDAHPDWKTSTVKAHCLLLNDDAEFVSSVHIVNNCSCPSHAVKHSEWLQSLGTEDDVSFLWEKRFDNYLGLRFLADTERQLKELQTIGAPYAQAIELINILNRDAIKWNGTDEPVYSTKVALGEHDQRRALVKFYDELHGKKREFGKHAYFNGYIAGRLHFEVDSTEKKFVIAYIGKKLV